MEADSTVFEVIQQTCKILSLLGLEFRYEDRLPWNSTQMPNPHDWF